MLEIVTLLSLASTQPLAGGDAWSGFRGPNGSGVSPAHGLPALLDPEKNIAWRTEIPKGYSSPVVDSQNVYVTVYEGRVCSTLAMSRESGEILWKADAPVEVPTTRRTPNSPVSSTPVADGERIIVAYECYGLVAYDLDGKELWKQELAPFNIPHGLATSPVIAGDNVVFLVDQDTDPYLVAFDKRSGERRWRVERTGVTHGYSTPIVYRPSEGPLQVIVSGSYAVTGYAAETGEKLWWVNGMCWQAKALPQIEKDTLYVLSAMGALSEYGGPKLRGTFDELLAEKDANADGLVGRKEWPDAGENQLWFLYDLDNDDQLARAEYEQAQQREHAAGGLFAIRLGGRGDLTGSNVVWTFDDKRSLPDLTSPLVHEGLIYLLRDNGVMTTLDAGEGKVLTNERMGSPDDFSASPVLGEGRLYCAGRSGQLVVVKSGKECSVLGATTLDEEIWATPAIADGQVLVRTEKALYSFVDVDG